MPDFFNFQKSIILRESITLFTLPLIIQKIKEFHFISILLIARQNFNFIIITKWMIYAIN